MECIICYNNTDLVKLFNCNHQFCLSCLNKIIKKDDNFKYIICPLCRNKTIRTSNLKLNLKLMLIKNESKYKLYCTILYIIFSYIFIFCIFFVNLKLLL